MSYTEEELITQLKHRDAKAFSYLYDNYSAALYGVIKRVLNAEDESNDTLQEVFVKIWNNMGLYDSSRGKLFTWMLNIARNAAIDKTRSADFRKEKMTVAMENQSARAWQPTDYTPVDHLGMNHVLDALNPDQKRIIDLAYFKGYTQEEIADTLGMPLGSVKTKIRNTLILLRQKL